MAEAVLMVALVMPPLLRHLLWSPTTALLLLTVLTALLSMFTLCDSSRPFLSCLRFSITLPSSRCLPRLFYFLEHSCVIPC